jgi:hypothetical protein
MLSIQDIADRFDRKMLKIDQATNEDQSRFIVSLLTADLPPQFENSARRKVDLSIVNESDWSGDTSTNAILIPLVLTGTSVIEGKTKSYYRQQYDGSNLTISNSPQIEGYVIHDNGSDDTLTTPHLLIIFGVEAQTDQDTQGSQGDRQGFSGSLQNGDLSTLDQRPHVDKGENAHGGLDLTPGTTKNDDVEQQRENQSRPDYQEA